MNPTDALQKLMAGNTRYVSSTMNSQNTPSDRVRHAQGQAPIAAIIRCADSRVAPEIVFDQPLGNLFVCGVAGNIPTEEIVESLEYAVDHLGTKLIVVMGHSNCGAVTAALASDSPTGLYAKIALSPFLELDESIAHNAEQGISSILSQSLIIDEAVKAGSLQIVAGVQDIASGEFDLIAQTQLA